MEFSGWGCFVNVKNGLALTLRGYTIGNWCLRSCSVGYKKTSEEVDLEGTGLDIVDTSYFPQVIRIEGPAFVAVLNEADSPDEVKAFLHDHGIDVVNADPNLKVTSKRLRPRPYCRNE